MSSRVSLNYYHKVMQEISSKVSPIMLDFADSLYKRVSSDSIADSVSEIIRTRSYSNRSKLRPFMLVVASGVRDFDEIPYPIIQLAAYSELLNIATYQANVGFDRKGKYKTQEEKTRTILSSMILRDIISEELSSSSNFSDNITKQVIGAFSCGYHEVSQGQYIDLINIPESCQEPALTPLDDFLSLYIQRCRLLGGSSLESVIAVGTIISELNSEKSNSLRTFGRYHGLALQAINDIADFAPVADAGKSLGKVAADQYSDLKNQKLTLPLYIAITYANSQDREYLSNFNGVDLNEEKLISILKYTNAFKLSLSLAKEADSIARKEIEDIEGVQGDLLRLSLRISKSNKFYTYLQERVMGCPMEIEDNHQLKMMLNFHKKN
jgi:geranylgeranyl pyrophosphate synthase